MISRTPVLLAFALLLPTTVFGESMRCGKWVVNAEHSPAELIAKCGEPQSREVTENEVLGRTPSGHSIRLGTQIVERWVYKRSTGALPMQVTIIDGKVTEIRRIES